MSKAKPMDLHKDQLDYVGVHVPGGRLDAYERQNGHTRLTGRQNKRYWKKQRQLLGRIYPQWFRELEWMASGGKGRPTARQGKRRSDAA